MRRSAPSPIAALAAVYALGCASGAYADPASLAALGAGYSAIDAPLGAPAELHIDLHGQVAPRCELTAPLAGFGDFDMNHRGAAQGAIAVDCNTPFLLRVRSQHGGFASDAALSGAQAVAPYQVALQVGTDRGRQDLGWCDSAALAAHAATDCPYAADGAHGGWSSGDAVAIGQTAALSLRWDAPGEGQARLGAYADTIVIELEVRS